MLVEIRNWLLMDLIRGNSMEENISLRTPLQIMQKMLEENYKLYLLGEISQYEYLVRIKPIDKEIGKLEMSTLQDTSASIEAFSPHTLKQGH